MTLKELKARLRAINAEAAATKEGDKETLDKLLGEAEEIQNKIAEAEARARLQAAADGAGEEDPAEGEPGEAGQDPENKASKRGKALMAGAAVMRRFEVKNTLTSSQTVLRKHNAEDVKETFNEVSSLVDRVKVIPLIGGESYKRGFIKGYGTGGYTDEGANYTAAEPVFGYAEMVKAKITAYCEEPEEITKLAPAEYDRVIGSSTEVAIKKYLSKQILVGAGGTGKLYGIFHNPANADDDIIDRNTDLEFTEIDKDTLDNIIYAFGGDEDVENVAVLILNKADLKKFATLRLTDGTKAYDVVNRGNTGTIDGVPYLINSACAAISAAATGVGEYCMAYGPLSNYELPIFSDMEVKRSNEYKFKQGQIAHRADIYAGGNVAAYNGFLRVKKKIVDSDSVVGNELTVTSAAGTTSGKTAITVTPALSAGRTYKYKTAATLTAPAVGTKVTGYTAWNGTAEIAATTGHKIVIVEVDKNDYCTAAGSATVTAAE